MNTYLVQAGDSPFSIAQRLTGDPRRMTELIAANPDKPVDSINGITTFESIDVGEELALPTTWETRGVGADVIRRPPIEQPRSGSPIFTPTPTGVTKRPPIEQPGNGNNPIFTLAPTPPVLVGMIAKGAYQQIHGSSPQPLAAIIRNLLYYVAGAQIPGTGGYYFRDQHDHVWFQAGSGSETSFAANQT
jgi:hypothetical protein